MNTQQKSEPVCLNQMKPGASARVTAIEAGRGLKGRLAALGILVNSALKIIRNDGNDQIIIQVKQSRIILGRGMTHKIFVDEI